MHRERFFFEIFEFFFKTFYGMEPGGPEDDM